MGVEIGCVGGDVLLHPIDVVVEQIQRLFALVDDFDSRRFAKRHVPIAIVGIAPFDHHRYAVYRAPLAETTGEELAERCLDSRLFAAIPVNPQQKLLMVCLALMVASLRRRLDKREPHVGNCTWTTGVENDVGSTGGHAEIVIIALFRGLVAERLGIRVVFSIGAAAESRCCPHAPPLQRFSETFEQALCENRFPIEYKNRQNK